MYRADDRFDKFIVEARDKILPAGIEYNASIVKGRLCAQLPGRPPPLPTEPVCTGEAIGLYIDIHIPYDE